MGRVDAAMLLSSIIQAPSRKHANVLDQWKRARHSRHGHWPPSSRQARNASIARRKLHLVAATVVTLIAAGIATWWLLGYRDGKRGGGPQASRQDLRSRRSRDSIPVQERERDGKADAKHKTETEAGVSARTRSKRKMEQIQGLEEKEEKKEQEQKKK